jgi:hypothetical protein
MAIIQDYEISFVGAERKWPIPYARLLDITPEAGHPAMLVTAVAGAGVGGVVLVTEDSKAVIDFTPGKISYQNVRNVITYAGAAESTFRAINIGDPVYYDASATMPAGVELSTSPLDSAGVANSLWGHVVPKDATDEALFPKGTTTASTQRCAVMQRGAGA